ncbi:type II toxin-antitoxin system RelE/ParE family toxin [Hanamia caeni]|jgi:toxin YoeB|uniref:Type II toxin-antitoxin system RelE/ParE family toxin n=1 Tax=Hanamia caeni TaxID=2294116 RepID=A0A3M9NS69_9BACT|nr:type II toxin-antitoxin system RelE/ParE family toxin [Hanamia caeni]RNI40053.1 type II toxin-antitoxin system RelE/ParE family toxin [Hanamia caeni]
MAEKVGWSLRAQNDRKKIFSYWNKRNKSNNYSIRLNRLFIEATKAISDYPKIGKITERENIRIKIVRDYLIVYKELENKIEVLTIFSSHQNPAKLKF